MLVDIWRRYLYIYIEHSYAIKYILKTGHLKRKPWLIYLFLWHPKKMFFFTNLHFHLSFLKLEAILLQVSSTTKNLPRIEYLMLCCFTSASRNIGILLLSTRTRSPCPEPNLNPTSQCNPSLYIKPNKIWKLFYSNLYFCYLVMFIYSSLVLFYIVIN